MNPIVPSILAGDPLLHEVWGHLGKPRRCRVTGGYLRDRLLGRPSDDFDLTIDGDAVDAAAPAQRLGRAHGVRPHLLGTPPRQIWRVETPVLKIELWPLGSLSHEADILRRDFTCNALSWELPDGPLVDLVEGLPDIEDRRLRAISRSNLEDDPVRLLRGPRFLAQLTDFELDDRTRGWIGELAPQLAEAPRERVGHELLTLLRAPAAARGLRACLDLGLFRPSGPEFCTVDSAWLEKHLDAADRLNVRADASRTPELPCGTGVPPAVVRSANVADAARLALLIRAWGLPSERVTSPYAWPKPVRDNALRAASMLDEALTAVEAAAADRRETAWRAGPAFPVLIAVAAALEPGLRWTRWHRQWQRNPGAFVDPQPLLSGLEIAAIADLEPGPELGDLVNGLLRAQVRGEVRSQRGARRWLARGR